MLTGLRRLKGYTSIKYCMRRAKLDRYDLASMGIIVLIILFFAIRFQYLPQFVDDYYHLSAANGFIRSGGWVGWSWWDFAPHGRPQIYPPVYHFLLAFLQKGGLSGLTSIRIAEVFIPCVFFFTLWYVIRFLTTSLSAFFTLLISSSFFSFYSAASANIPATLALT